jgi:hypothetical protein
MLTTLRRRAEAKQRQIGRMIQAFSIADRELIGKYCRLFQL